MPCQPLSLSCLVKAGLQLCHMALADPVAEELLLLAREDKVERERERCAAEAVYLALGEEGRAG